MNFRLYFLKTITNILPTVTTCDIDLLVVMYGLDLNEFHLVLSLNERICIY